MIPLDLHGTELEPERQRTTKRWIECDDRCGKCDDLARERTSNPPTEARPIDEQAIHDLARERTSNPPTEARPIDEQAIFLLCTNERPPLLTTRPRCGAAPSEHSKKRLWISHILPVSVTLARKLRRAH
jgi:hypothetical protein